MRYRLLLTAAVAGLTGLLSVPPATAPQPRSQPTAGEIDAALALAEREAGLPPRVRR